MDNRLEARAGNGGSFGFALEDLAVADFYRKLVDGLAALGVEAAIDPRPFDLDDEQPLDRNYLHRTCDPEYVRRYWWILVWVDGVFQTFAGRFNGELGATEAAPSSPRLHLLLASDAMRPTPCNR